MISKIAPSCILSMSSTTATIIQKVNLIQLFQPDLHSTPMTLLEQNIAVFMLYFQEIKNDKRSKLSTTTSDFLAT